MAKTLIGLDLGNSAVKFAVRKGRQTRFYAAVLPENMVADGRVQMAASMTSFLRNERKKQKIPGGDCCLILPDQQVFCRLISMPYMPENQLVLNLPYEFRDYITQNNDKYYYDYSVERVVNDEEGKPASIELLAAAVSKEAIKSYSELFAGTGFRFAAAIPREMAYVYILRGYEKANPAQSREYCLCDIGRETTRVHFFTGTRLAASRSLELGCRDVDLAIAELKNVDEYVAASYKLTNYQDVLASDACREACARIAVEVMKAVNFYRFRNSETKLADIYFLGGGARLAPLREQIVEAIRLEPHDFTELLPFAATDEAALQAALCAGAVSEEGGLRP